MCKNQFYNQKLQILVSNIIISKHENNYTQKQLNIFFEWPKTIKHVIINSTLSE